MNPTHATRASAILAFAFALLSAPLNAQDGWATYGGSVTGGAGGPTVTVSTLADLQANIGDDVPRIVQVSGTINLGSTNINFGSNKTIIGVGTTSGFIGNLKGVNKTNVIIQHLNFTNPSLVGDGDGLSLEGCTRVWVDHCAFVDCGDGSLDIKRAADLITVTWCKFSYTFNSGHNFVNLIGHSDSNGAQDRGKLRITWHHNWWSTLCVERMPRIRFGRVHLYNNYFNAPGNNYCIRASIESEALSEHNYFENIDEPYNYFAPNGLIKAVGDVHVNCTNVLTVNDPVFTPPYSYTLDPALDVKALVTANAGPGGGGGGGGPPPNPPAAPSNLGATAVSASQINLSWTDNASDESGFRIERSADGTNFTEVATTGANVTSHSDSGLSSATTYWYRVRAYNGGGNSAYSNTASATTQSGGSTTVTFISIAAHDGRILETTETSNVGGTVDSTGSSSTTMRIGDDSSNRQYKTFLSFDTSSLPDGATITSAVVKMVRGGSSGTNPFTTHGTCHVDIKGGSGFNNSLTLESADFQAAADATQVAVMSNAAANGDWSSGSLNATGLGLINKTGHTQFRIYFSLDDNNDNGNDYIGYRSGNDSNAANRPVLEVTYQ